MRRIATQLIGATGGAITAIGMAAPAFAQEHGPVDGLDYPVGPSVIWSIAAIAGGAVIFGVLYLFKKQIGGFPEHPEWTAPIEIMPSSEFPDDSTYGDVSGEPHAQGAHH